MNTRRLTSNLRHRSQQVAELSLRRMITHILSESNRVDAYRDDRRRVRASMTALDAVYQDLSSTVAEWQELARIAARNKVMDFRLTAAAYESCVLDLNELLPAINPRAQRQGLAWLHGMLIELAADWRRTATRPKQNLGYRPIARDGATFIVCAEYLENDIIPWIVDLIAEHG